MPELNLLKSIKILLILLHFETGHRQTQHTHNERSKSMKNTLNQLNYYCMIQVERTGPIIEQTQFGLNLDSVGLKIRRQFFGRVPYDCITRCRIFSKIHHIWRRWRQKSKNAREINKIYLTWWVSVMLSKLLRLISVNTYKCNKDHVRDA